MGNQASEEEQRLESIKKHVTEVLEDKRTEANTQLVDLLIDNADRTYYLAGINYDRQRDREVLYTLLNEKHTTPESLKFVLVDNYEEILQAFDDNMRPCAVRADVIKLLTDPEGLDSARQVLDNPGMVEILASVRKRSEHELCEIFGALTKPENRDALETVLENYDNTFGPIFRTLYPYALITFLTGATKSETGILTPDNTDKLDFIVRNSAVINAATKNLWHLPKIIAIDYLYQRPDSTLRTRPIAADIIIGGEINDPMNTLSNLRKVEAILSSDQVNIITEMFAARNKAAAARREEAKGSDHQLSALNRELNELRIKEINATLFMLNEGTMADLLEASQKANKGASCLSNSEAAKLAAEQKANSARHRD